MKGKKKGKLHSQRNLTKKDKLKALKPGVTGYIARSQVTKRLQLTLAQFRELCIYKGIHPVEPGLKSVRSRKDKTWYYLKDINFMRRDEINKYFRDIHTYKKKVNRLKDLGRYTELVALKERKPRLNMDHYVQERYPTLQDAVNDLDDALSLICLFVEMQYGATAQIMKKKQFEECIRLKNEWHAFVARNNYLRKVFVSIKGIYYQADVLGSVITWLVPHSQRISVPSNTDVLTMTFFVQFYTTMVNFVLYRLYTDMGLVYPPNIDKVKLPEHCINAITIENVAPKTTVKLEAAPAPAPTTAPLTAIERERVAIVNSKLPYIIAIDEKNNIEDQTTTEIKTEPTDEEIPEEFRKVDEEAGENKEQYVRPSKLFSGLTFFINREIPKQDIIFVIHAFGGSAFTELDGDVSDASITHHIVDRVWPKEQMLINREYIQPQWIFDSVNAGILLPYHEYAPDATLPPHISPFVNDVAKGYVPEQREHLDELIAQAKSEGKALFREEKGEKEKEEESDGEKYIGESDDEDTSTIEAQYERELAAEQEGRSYAGYVMDELGLTEAPQEGEAEESDEEMTQALKKKPKTKKEIQEEKQKEDELEREKMAIGLLNAKTRKIIKTIKTRVEYGQAKNAALQAKREKIEKDKKKAAKHALPAEPKELVGKRKNEGNNSKSENKKAKKAKVQN